MAGEFNVSQGKLFSIVGSIYKEATFSDWTYVFAADGKKVIGWGACLTSGEVIVSNIFTKEVPSDVSVKNSFIAESFGDQYTLIKLDPSKDHKLCIWIKVPDFFGLGGGAFSVNDQMKLSGKVADSKGTAEDYFFQHGRIYRNNSHR